MNVGALALIGALVYALMNFLKYVRAKDRNGIVSQLAVWVGGIAVMFLASAAEVTNTFMFNEQMLVDLDAGSKIILGLMASSLFATVPYDFKKAFDGSDSAATPALMPPAKIVTQSGEAVDPSRPLRADRA